MDCDVAVIGGGIHGVGVYIIEVKVMAEMKRKYKYPNKL